MFVIKRDNKVLFSICVILFFLLASLAGCHENREKINPQAFENFSFRKIQQYIEDSAHYFKAIDSIYSTLPYAQRLYETYGCKRGYYYTIKRDYLRSLDYSDSMLFVLKNLKNEAGYPYWYSTALSYKADDLHALKRYNEAFAFYFLAREAIFKTGDSCQFTNYSARLGLVAYQHKHYTEAAGYFKEAFDQQSYCHFDADVNKEHLIFANQQANLDNIGLCYSKLNVHDSALHYFKRALDYIDQNFQKAFRYDAQNKKIIDTVFLETAKAVIYGNMAKDLMETGNDSAAERLLKESIRVNGLPLHAQDDVPYSLSKLADLYIRNNRLDEAAETLSTLKDRLNDFPNAEISKRWNLLQSKMAQKNNDFQQANNYLARYTEIKDSIEISERGVLTSDINKELSYFKNQYELYALQKEDDLKTLYLIIAGIGTGMAILVMLLFWRNYRQSKKHIAVLGALNEQIFNKNEHLQKALSALEKSHEENSRMMKVVAHDLRNPVGGIAGMSDFLLQDNNYLPAQRKMLEMINKTGHHAVQLIQELIETKHPEKDADKVPVDLVALVSYCVDMLTAKAAEKKQVISLQSIPVMVSGDREKLWRVFSNLIGNAIKFSPENHPIDVDFTMKGTSVIIAVKDKGIGIPENLQEKIFHLSDDSKRKGTSGEPSYGLGLAICNRIVESHGGNIWFENRAGGGTVFYVSFPAIEKTI